MSFISNIRAFILFIILIFITLYNSYLGMLELYDFATPLAITILFFLLINLSLSPKNLLFFISLFISVLLSVLINYKTLHIGGYNSAIYTIILLLLLSINLKDFNYNLFIKFLTFYLFVVSFLSLYLWYEGIYFDDFFISRDGAFFGRYGKMAIAFFLNPNRAGVFFLFCFLLSLFFVNNKYLKFLLLGINFFLVLFSYSRGSIFALLLSTMFYYSVLSSNLLSTIKLYLSSFLLLIITSLSVFFLFPEYFKGIVFKLTSFGSNNRIHLWEIVINDSFDSLIRFLFGAGPSSTSISSFSSHNSYINEFSNLGFLFISILTFYIFNLIIEAYRDKNFYFLTFLIAALFLGLVETMLFVEPTFLWFGIIMIKLLTFNKKMI